MDTYFSGLGSGKGWDRFAFILTPKELEQVFDGLDFSFINTSSGMETAGSTPVSAIFEAYRIFFEKILTGNELLNQKEMWEIERKVRISIIADIKDVEFEDIPYNEKEQTGGFKMARPQEPVIHLQPLYLYLKQNGQLSISIFNTEGVIGLELTFPKFISWKKDNFSKHVSTEAYKTNALYKVILTQIKNLAHKATVSRNDKQFKPNFWVSGNAAAIINRNKYLVKNSLIIR